MPRRVTRRRTQDNLRMIDRSSLLLNHCAMFNADDENLLANGNAELGICGTCRIRFPENRENRAGE